jgi:transcriptional regulator with XRE-family HTH domain
MTQTINELLGLNLVRLREAKQLSQDDLAKLLGLDQSTVSKYESGRRWPGSDTFALLAEHLEVSAAELLLAPGQRVCGGGHDRILTLPGGREAPAPAGDVILTCAA